MNCMAGIQKVLRHLNVHHIIRKSGVSLCKIVGMTSLWEPIAAFVKNQLKKLIWMLNVARYLLIHYIYF